MWWSHGDRHQNLFYVSNNTIKVNIVENPLLPGAGSAIGAALNPTFPTGPANIIVPQTDVGHGLSGSATDNSLLAASSLGSDSEVVVSSNLCELFVVMMYKVPNCSNMII
jgi:hypothetical protein